MVSATPFITFLIFFAVAGQLEAAKPSYEILRDATAPDIQHYLQTNPPLSLDATAVPPLERRTETGNAIREFIGSQNELFSSEFWKKHPSYYPIKENSDVWQSASWSDVASWLEDSITGPPLYFDSQSAYPASGADTPTEGIDESGSDWLPLGVFALTRESKYMPAPKIYMQLALNKSGAIAGNLYDTAYEESFPLIGMVGSGTQRAVWKMLHSANTPIIETGLYNLTRDETPVKLTFSDGRTQEFFLVRIRKEKEMARARIELATQGFSVLCSTD